MIALPLYRDQAREVRDFFFPYLREVCELKTREANNIKDGDGVLVGRMMLCLVISSQIKIDRKLLTTQNKFKVKLSDSEAICLYQLLMKFPIDQQLHYDWMLRQEICNFLYDQLCLENIKIE